MDLRSIKDGYQFCMDRYDEVRQLSSRVKRRRQSLLPFMGKLLDGLFGVVSGERLDVVTQQIQALIKGQVDIVHTIDENISVLNMTRVELKENRHAIRELNRWLEGATGQIVNSLLPFKHFVLAYLQIQLRLGELRDSLNRAMTYITRVELKLNQLALGHLSPAILPPPPSNYKRCY